MVKWDLGGFTMVKKKVEKEVEVTKKVEEKVEHTKSKTYYGYNFKLTKNILLFIVLLGVSFVFLVKAFTVEEQKVINYKESSNLDYKVYLKENEFYEEEYLTKDMAYIATLIDKVKIDFNYNFDIEEFVDLQFDYKIFAKLIISDEQDKNTFYEKVYDLSKTKSVTLDETKNKKILESIELNYDEYNTIANNFKNAYGIDTTSKLVVYFNINKKVLKDKNSNLFVNNNVDNMVINIPLSQKALNISMDYKDINNESYVADNTKVMLDNIICLCVSLVSLILSLVYMIRAMRLFNTTLVKKDKYDKYISKILSEYDRLIVETSTAPLKSFEDKEKVIKISKFTELLDVRDNLKQPIMYYVVTKHQKCHFYITANDKIYLTTIKRVDIEEE